MRSAFARCSGLKRKVSSVGRAWDEVVKIEGEEIPEIEERGGSSIRSREWCLEVLSYSELEYHISIEKTGQNTVIVHTWGYLSCTFC